MVQETVDGGINMEFDITRVYTAKDADELEIGSIVIAGTNIGFFKEILQKDYVSDYFTPLKKINPDTWGNRFHTVHDFPYVYFIEPPKKLKWTDLKIGDVIIKKGDTYKIMVVGIDYADAVQRIYNGIVWLSDEELEDWEKVENDSSN